MERQGLSDVRRERAERSLTAIDRVVACPSCHELCGWCSWYAKNARSAGCGLSVPSGYGYRTKRRCEWGEQLKGTTCQTCSGSERVRLVGRYEALELPPAVVTEGGGIDAVPTAEAHAHPAQEETHKANGA
jgi:hypothetical protein